MENLALISAKSPNPTFPPSKQCLNLHLFTQKPTGSFCISKPTAKSLNFAFSAHNSHAHIISTSTTNYNENTNSNARNFDGINFFATTSTAYTPPSSSSKLLKNNKMQDAGKTRIDFGDNYPTLARKISGTTIDISHLCKTKNKVYLDAYIKEILPGNPPKTNADTSLRSSSEEAKSAKVVQKEAVSKEATSSELPQEKGK